MATHAHERLHALDGLRGFALLLGIVLHATMSFFLVIPAEDVSRSGTLGITFYVIHTFRMTVFFLIAGFFAHLACNRRGVRGFVKDRAKRVLVPMTVGWVVLAPATIAVVLWGLTRTFADGPPDGVVAPAVPEGLPLIHLWFLYYLCIFYLAALALRWAVLTFIDRRGTLRNRVDKLVSAGISAGVAPLVLAAPLFAVLYADAGWPVWFGIPTPETGLLPKLPALAGFGTAFAIGWLLHRQTRLLGTLERRWALNLALGAALTTGCLAIVGLSPSMSAPTALEGGAAMRALYAGAYAISIWYWTFGLLGAALRFWSAESATRRYLADASYWLYLVHLPVVFALQVVTMDWPLPWPVKFPLIIGITLAVLLASYHYLVRPTLIGEILNGRRYPASPAPAVLTTGTEATAAAALTGVSKRYGDAVALDDLHLAVQPGELLAVLGPNGAGKTTAIGLWLGTLSPDEGIATIMGGSPLDVGSRLGVGVMLQDVSFAPALRAREIIALTASYYRDPLTVEETLALAGIEMLANQRYGRMSAGQKRQVQFAAAICGRPKLILLDEPTVGLDVQAREAMWRAIRRLLSEGCGIVLTTHYLEEAEVLADRVAVLARGKLIAEGSVAEMRALVTRKRISCASTIDVNGVRAWPGVVEAVRDGHLVHVTAFDAEGVVRRLLAADDGVSHLEVRQASLAEAFTELTREAA